MSCIDSLKKSSPEVHDYLREKAGVDFNPETEEGKEAWIKAAKDLQEHSLNEIHDVYNQAGIKGYEKKSSEIKNNQNEKINNTEDGRTAGETNQSSANNIKKPQKEKGILERAREIEPIEPYDRVLHYFSSGGKIDTSVVESLFGNNNKSVEGQRKAMIAFIKKGGQTIDQLAHSLWQSDNTESYDTQDYKNAIEQALNEHSSPSAMAKELVSRNDPDEALKEFLTDRYGEDLGSKENVLDAVSIVEGMSAEEINNLLEMDADETRQNELDNYVDNLHENISSQSKIENDASTQSNQQQQAGNQQSSVTEHARVEQAGGEGKATSAESSDSDKRGEGGQKEVTNKGGDNKPPNSASVENEEDSGDNGFTSIRKEKLKEIESVKKIFEKETGKRWSDIQQSALEDVQKEYPNKNLYEAVKAKTEQIADKFDNNIDYNPTTKDLAVIQEFKRQTENKISQTKDEINSDIDSVRKSAILNGESYENDLLNIGKALHTKEAGTAFGFRQSESRNDENYGLQIKRMQLLRAKGGEKLTPDEEAFAEQKWNEQKEIMRQEQEVRERSMKEDFEKKIADLEAKLNDKNNKPKVDKTTKEKTLSQSGKDVADKIRKLKLSGTKVDFTLGGWNLAVEGIAKLVEGGATIADAIKTLIDKKEIGFKDEKDKVDFENLFVDRLNKKDKGESLEAIKKYAAENNLTDVSKEMVGKNLIADYVNSHIGEVEQKDLLTTAAKDLKEILPEVTKKKLIEAYLKEGDYKQDTKKDLEGGIAEQKKELKRLAQKEFDVNATDAEIQKKLLEDAKNAAEKIIKEFQRRIDEGDYEDKPPKQSLNKSNAELIKLQKQQSTIEEQFRKKQREIREANKSNWQRAADFARSVYVGLLIGSFKTLAKVASLAGLRPASEGFTKFTLGKVYTKFFPGIARAALRGGESSSNRSIKKGFEAYFIQKGAKGIEEMAAKSENAFQKSDKEYNDYKQTINDLRLNNPNAKLPLMDKKLKDLKKERDNRLLGTMGNLIYQFIGGSSIKDAIKSLVHRSNEIEKQFGKVEGESFKNGSALDKISYVLGFIGRSHSALKTFSGRYSFAAGFMARLEGAVKDNVDLTSDKVLEIAHESYLDWEQGKYQQDNAITTWWNRILNTIDRGQTPQEKQVSDIASSLLRFDVAITRVPINILHEQVMEYAFGAFRAAILGSKAVREAKVSLADEGILKDSEGFKEALREKVSQMNPQQAATIVRAFRKGGVGIGLYTLATIIGGVHFGIFPHLGQKKKKDESMLGPDELNPGQVMFGDTKFGELASGVIEHIPALWPTFMGLGMAQAYHDQIKKGRTTSQAAMSSAYTHFKIIEGSIPQTKIIAGLQEDVVNTVKKRLTDSGVIDKALPNGYEKEDTKDPNFKYVMDKGVVLPLFSPTTIEIKDEDVAGNPVIKKLSEFPEEKVTEFNNERKANLKESIQNLVDGEAVYLDKYGKPALSDTGEHDKKTTIDELKPEQLKEVISLLGGKATKETKAKLFGTSEAE